MEAQDLILKKCDIGALILDFLKTLLLLLVVAHQMIVFPLLLFKLVVDLENFDFCIKILSYILLMAPEINEPIPFYNWAF